MVLTGRGAVRERRDGRDDSGAIAILAAIFAVVMFGFAAVVVDLGAARATRGSAQKSADASALAAANVLYPPAQTAADIPAAVQAAKQYALANYGTAAGEWAGCADTGRLSHVPLGGTSCISFDAAGTPTRLRVRIPPRDVTSFFGGIVGYDGLTISAVAEVTVDEQPPDCVLCVIEPVNHNFDKDDLRVDDGSVWVNGNVDLGGSGRISTTGAGVTNVEGTLTPASRVTGMLKQGAGAVTDPLADVAPGFLSDLASYPTTPVKTNPCSDGPGYYAAVTLPTSGGPCTLSPDPVTGANLYIFRGTLNVPKARTLVTSGVTLYFPCGTAGTCASAGQGRLDLRTDNFALTAPTTGPRTGLAVLYDQFNNAALKLAGKDAAGDITGTVYAPAAGLDMPKSCAGTTFDAMVIVGEITSKDNCLSLSYDAARNVPLNNRSTGLSK
ncbi:MAG: pilus assembly protein TadG-related protein [Spirochaetaceae bacterium]|nr:pilus assembly protein TadG-related protein [Spirochaetaceae bacterium]